MNFYDFMRLAFGLNESGRPGWFKDPSQNNGINEPGFRDPIWDPDGEDDSDSEFRNVPSTPFGFRIFTGDPFDMHRFFEQQFDDMLRSFGAHDGPSMFGSDLLDVPDMQEEPRMLPPSSDHIHPQDRYLKPSFERRFPDANRKDSDIDGQFEAQGSLQDLVPNEKPYQPNVPPGIRSFSQSVISRTIRRPDGGVEQHKTMTGSNGEEVTIVTRKLGDQSHTLTTTKKSDGQIEKTEELVNMNEGDIQSFERKWSGYGDRVKALPSPKSEDRQRLLVEPLLSFIDRFFK